MATSFRIITRSGDDDHCASTNTLSYVVDAVDGAGNAATRNIAQVTTGGKSGGKPVK